MSKGIIIAIISVLVVAGGIAGFFIMQKAGEEVAIETVAENAFDIRVESASTAVIKSKAELDTVWIDWTTSLGVPPRNEDTKPTINFGEDMLIAVFMGRKGTTGDILLR